MEIKAEKQQSIDGCVSAGCSNDPRLNGYGCRNAVK